MPVDSNFSSRPAPFITWTTAARWCTLIGGISLLTILGWVWLDNHGEPWIWWVLILSATPAGVLTIFSALAWRGRGWVQKTGWWLLGIYAILMLRYIFYVSHGRHWAWR